MSSNCRRRVINASNACTVASGTLLYNAGPRVPAVSDLIPRIVLGVPLSERNGNIYALGTSDSTTTLTFTIENGAVTGFEANANGIKRILKKIK